MSLIEFEEPTTAGFIRFQIDTAYVKADDPHQYGVASTIRLREYMGEGPSVSPLTPNVVQGQEVELQVIASGGTEPYYYEASGLPEGLTIDPATGVISGIPTETGTFSATVTVIDASGLEGTGGIQLTVAAAPVDETGPVIQPVANVKVVVVTGAVRTG